MAFPLQEACKVIKSIPVDLTRGSKMFCELTSSVHAFRQKFMCKIHCFAHDGVIKLCIGDVPVARSEDLARDGWNISFFDGSGMTCFNEIYNLIDKVGHGSCDNSVIIIIRPCVFNAQMFLQTSQTLEMEVLPDSFLEKVNLLSIPNHLHIINMTCHNEYNLAIGILLEENTGIYFRTNHAKFLNLMCCISLIKT